MTDAVISGIFQVLAILVSGVVSAVVSNKLMKYRIEQLEKKVDKHNSVIDRTYHLESEVEVLKTEIENLQK